MAVKINKKVFSTKYSTGKENIKCIGEYNLIIKVEKYFSKKKAIIQRKMAINLTNIFFPDS